MENESTNNTETVNTQAVTAEIIEESKPGNPLLGKKLPVFEPKHKRTPLDKWIKESKNAFSITRKDIAYVYRNIIFVKTFGELQEIYQNEKKRNSYPAFVIAVIASVLGDIARGNMSNLIKMIDFIFPESELSIVATDYSHDVISFNEMQEVENTLKLLEGNEILNIIDKLHEAKKIA